MSYLIDADICVFYLRGEYSLNQKVKEAQPENCFVSEITIVELIYGARMSNDYSRHIKEIVKVKSLFEIILIEEVYDDFAKEKVQLKKEGALIPDFDIFIGSTALAKGLTMVTNNEKHLMRIRGISIENWTKPDYNYYLES